MATTKGVSLLKNKRQISIASDLFSPSTPHTATKPSTSANDRKHDSAATKRIGQLNKTYEQRYAGLLKIETSLNRQLVSFQANKTCAAYRWYKFKEGFSVDLVEYFLNAYNLKKGTLLDPFAGSGTALFAASAMGMRAEGIELLPSGQRIIKTRQLLDTIFTPEDTDTLAFWIKNTPWANAPLGKPLNELRITRGAYPLETLRAIRRYISRVKKEPSHIQEVLRFALLSILESVSYTRKDGQYLRWDHRSGRRQGVKRFDKGAILSFHQAITGKLAEIISDIRQKNVSRDLFRQPTTPGAITLYPGSCLTVLPKLRSGYYNCILTSPPYCNRYDYTRTYALELAMLGMSEGELMQLRQDMLSCTVESRAKNLVNMNRKWSTAIAVADNERLLQAILSYLNAQKAQRLLNNNGIPQMVRGYFYEMACVIVECARVLKKNAPLIMVNDNVRYAGVGISVDIILSALASSLGFTAETILILPNGKGNSSQQMGEHGREALRKCVYIWRKK